MIQHMFPDLGLDDTDPAQHLITADYVLDDLDDYLDRDLLDV